MNICDRIVVLEFGKVIAAGSPDEVRRDPQRRQGVPRRRDGRAAGRARGRRERYAGGDPMSTPVLEIDGLTAGYDSAAVLRGLDLVVQPGEVVALLGANGAGKTTTLRAVSGLVHPMQGSIRFAGRDLSHVKASARARLGIAHVPESRGLFFGLTVAEHLRLGYRRRADRRRRRLPLLPCARRASRPALRPPLGRRAADARGRDGRSPGTRRSCCWTSSASAWPRSSSKSLLPVVRRATPRRAVAVSCSSSSTSNSPSRSRTAATCSPTGRSSCSGEAEELRANHELLISSYFGEHADLYAGKPR